MGKYIIETDETVADSIQGYLGFPIEICGKRTWVKTDVKLTHYTEPDEPDLDAIRKEVFEKGYSTAVAEQECAVRGAAEKAYQRGLNDAWNAARKIYLPEDHGGFGYKLCEKIFNACNTGWLFKNLSASEAIEKIRVYEQEQEEKKESCQNCKFAKNPKAQEPCVRCSHSFYDFFRAKEKESES